MIIKNPAVNTKSFLKQVISLAVDQIDGFIVCQTDETFINVLEYQKEQIQGLSRYERIQYVPKEHNDDVFRALQYAQDELESMLDDKVVSISAEVRLVKEHNEKIKQFRRSVYGRTMGEVIDDRIEANRKNGDKSELFDTQSYLRKKW